MTLELPAELVRDAQEFGLLTEAAIVELLRKEIDQRVMALVNKEIHDYRAEKRTTDTSPTES
jgi:hypothetical protein